jgi:hypothetical protein
MFSPVPSNPSINNPSSAASSSSISSRPGSRAGTPTAMEVIMNGASYLIMDPAALVPVGQTNAFISVERPNGFLPIETVQQEPSINEMVSSDCTTHNALHVEAPVEKVTSKKLNGRDKGAVGYSAEEHAAMLSFISATPNSFNASESSPEWRAVHQKMLDVYKQMNVAPRQSTTLHGHFVDLYSALKQGIRALSLQSGAPKCPTNLTDAVDEESEVYVKALLEMLQSDKKFSPKKWWSVEVTQQLLKLHLDYNTVFGGNMKQDVNWLSSQRSVIKSKFENDQKNREHEIARKRAAEEEERVEAAKTRKLMADNSSKLVECLEASLARDETVVNDKINQLDQKIDSKFSTVDRRLGQIDNKFDSIMLMLQRIADK